MRVAIALERTALTPRALLRHEVIGDVAAERCALIGRPSGDPRLGEFRLLERLAAAAERLARDELARERRVRVIARMALEHRRGETEIHDAPVTEGSSHAGAGVPSRRLATAGAMRRNSSSARAFAALVT